MSRSKEKGEDTYDNDNGNEEGEEEEEEDHSLSFIKSVFPDQSFYEILGVEKTCLQEDIKKAYRKLALKFHPDRDGGSENHFKAISIVYSTLSDEEKRKIYDEGGQTSDAGGLSGDFDFWYKYYRDMFPPVTVTQIDEYKEKYVNTPGERDDIIKCYREQKGDMMKMINYIMFAEVNDGDNMKRIIEIVEQAISLGEIDVTAKFTSSKVKLLSSRSGSGGGADGKKKPAKRHKPASHEEDLTEENCDENYDDDNDNDNDNNNDMKSNSNSNSNSNHNSNNNCSNSNKEKGGSAPKVKSSSNSKSRSKVAEKDNSGSMDDLIAAIQRNRENNGMKSKIDELEKRYASKPTAATSKRK